MRRIIVRILAALLSLALYTGAGFLVPEAAAAYTCENQGAMCNEGVAYQQCMSAAAATDAYLAQVGGGSVTSRCTRGSFGGRALFKCAMYTYQEFPCRPNAGGMNFYYAATCDTRSDYNGAFPGSQYKPRSGSTSCDLGCNMAWFHNADGTVNGTPTGGTCTGDDYDSDEDCAKKDAGSYYNRQIGVCEPQKPECPTGNANSLGKCEPEPCPGGMVQQQDGTCKKKDNECPAGQVRSPDGSCLPGDGQCAAGEVRGPDGTCKRDSDNDGEPDEHGPDDKETFSGGDDCSSPPSCSGSPILCGQARIQWRIECNTRRNRNIAGGSCSAMPVCTGEKCDALEYSGLLMQWRAACALEKLASGSGGSGENGDVKAIRDALTGTNGAVTTPADRPVTDVWAPNTGTPVQPDTGGYGWSRTCPQPPSIDVFGSSISLDTGPICNWLILGGYFVMGLAALFSLRIIATRDA
ncbi:virulence factor TspB C-terminal domain-related protein [Stenotrophomonas maltophilia]|nr:virulence factor TspB C-terminal domain-related protein [Stenotrophomonas maltophilia]